MRRLVMGGGLLILIMFGINVHFLLRTHPPQESLPPVQVNDPASGKEEHTPWIDQQIFQVKQAAKRFTHPTPKQTDRIGTPNPLWPNRDWPGSEFPHTSQELQPLVDRALNFLQDRLTQVSEPAAPWDKKGVTYGENPLFRFDVPEGVEPEHEWRYQSKGLYWNKEDSLFRKAQQIKAAHQGEWPPRSVTETIERVCGHLERIGRSKLSKLFRNCFPSTLDTTTTLLDDSTTWIITGDIPLMWMRDSAAQVNQYIDLAPHDELLQVVIEGTIRRQIKWMLLDPYGSSFRLLLDYRGAGKKLLTDWDYQSGRTIHVSMHNYELDSPCYFIRLSYRYWKATNMAEIFDEEWLAAAQLILDMIRVEQHHSKHSHYQYPALRPPTGSKVCETGMTWVGYRPSDDACRHHYLVPANMFAVVALEYLEEILVSMYPDEVHTLAQAEWTRTQIDQGIATHAVHHHPEFGPMYAYEVDGCGSVNLMDDANVPSLLSLDYLGYRSAHDPTGAIRENTRRFILSENNPFYFAGQAARGIGSPHTPGQNIWHMAIVMHALTSSDSAEINELIDMLETTDAGEGLMHESFHKDDPSSFTRHWFAWANSLFSELILEHLGIISPA